jgi:hypothetical protein
MQIAYEDEALLEKYAAFIREIGHIPVAAEFRLKSKQDATLPSQNTFNRFGNKQQLIKRIIDYCEANKGYEEVLAIALPEWIDTTISDENEDIDSGNQSEIAIGFVYMLKTGRNFKIGRSNSFDRRSRELKIQLPDQAETVHVIRTDDPIGIEAYWHKRFEVKRKNGEWFELSSQDVKAFKRRKFM